MNDSLEDAYKEALTLAKADEVILDTLEVKHTSIPDSIFLVRDRQNHNLTLEGAGGEKLFLATGFNFVLPATGANGIQTLNIAIDDVDGMVFDFIEQVKESRDKVTIVYRPYLLSDPSKPQTNPPLTLFLTDIISDPLQSSGRASFADLVNKSFAFERYLRERFPGLAN